MNNRSIEGLRQKIRVDYATRDYVVINNLSANLDYLYRISNYDLNDIKNKSKQNLYLAESFTHKLDEFVSTLLERDIPLDGIEIKGSSGLVLDSRKHRELVDGFMRFHFSSDDPDPSEYGSKDSLSTYIRAKIKNIKLSDTLYNLVPLNLTFEPYIRVNGDKKSLFSNFKLGIEKTNFENIVWLNEFIKGLNDNGYHLTYNGVEIKSYEEYFNNICSTTSLRENLSIDVDLTDNNNIRR